MLLSEASRELLRAEVLDVTDAAASQRMINEVAERHGQLDYVFNCAGVGAWGDARFVPETTWQRVVEVNYWGTVYTSLAAYRLMTEQGFGHIVNVSSLAGLVSAPTAVPYAAAKHAVVGFSTSLRAEAQSLGVRVSVVCPGPIATGFHDALITSEPSRPKPRPPADSVSVDSAAATILKGVRRNRAVIVFPRRARWLWRFYRWLPFLFAPTNRRTMKNFRAPRRNDGD